MECIVNKNTTTSYNFAYIFLFCNLANSTVIEVILTRQLYPQVSALFKQQRKHD